MSSLKCPISTNSAHRLIRSDLHKKRFSQDGKSLSESLERVHSYGPIYLIFFSSVKIRFYATFCLDQKRFMDNRNHKPYDMDHMINDFMGHKALLVPAEKCVEKSTYVSEI